ncbi:transcriptional regulator [Nocardiopsis dassonvillei]|jgi:hypothetical protein|uniref:transcriptional regulator n=1 Tax=Nocardiopsis dassonvillei TaxID=2014 RepID=UPI0008FC9D52|nr:transcriptional regulator [Nocardiopsis dassonvillei]ASU60502.1 transcriptional regulator [Nocardiopsis dassonvillei]MCP3014562.1 hypothetical protein [Nocardiopsis dassonvillei]
MSQVTWRAEEELVRRVRCTAERRGVSMNEYLTRVLSAATDPELEGDEAEAIRAKLAQAGLLDSSGTPRTRPSREAFERARRATAGGTPLEDLVAEGRE